jgi:hypothetical protein
MSTTSLDSTGLPHLRDVEGTPIPLDSRVEQVTVDEEHGALPSRLHQQGHAVGRGTHLLYVRFDCDKETVALRPQLARPHHGRCLMPTTTLVTPQRGIDPAASTVPMSRVTAPLRLSARTSAFLADRLPRARWCARSGTSSPSWGGPASSPT